MATAKKAAKTKAKPKANPAKTKRVSSKAKETIRWGELRAASNEWAAQPRVKKNGRPTAENMTDWDAVERDYRTGKFTDRELSAKHGVSPQTISARRAADKKRGHVWTKDLRDLIRAETDAAVIAEMTGAARESVGEQVLAMAELGKQVIIGHRKDIRDVRDFAAGLLRELVLMPEFVDVSKSILAEVFRQAQQPLGDDESPEARTKRLEALIEQQGRLRKVVYDVADIHARVTSARGLADILTKLQTLERKAFDLDRGDGGSTYEALLDQVLQ